MRRLWISHTQPNATPFLTFCLIRQFSYNRNHTRKIYEYREHPTLSLGTLAPLRKNASDIMKIKRYSASIRYHGELRGILFFMQAIGVYKQNHIIIQGPTKLQHGRNRKHHYLRACHSSLFPGILDYKPNVRSIVSSKASIFDNTVLDHMSNSTVLAPIYLNISDGLIDGFGGSISIYRKDLLAALNCVSLGTRNPVWAMQCYYKTMRRAFTESLKRIKKQKWSQQKELRLTLLLQRQGAFRHASLETDTPKQSFVKKILDQQPGESREAAYLRTQKLLLLKGTKKNARELLKRFQQKKRGRVMRSLFRQAAGKVPTLTRACGTVNPVRPAIDVGADDAIQNNLFTQFHAAKPEDKLAIAAQIFNFKKQQEQILNEYTQWLANKSPAASITAVGLFTPTEKSDCSTDVQENASSVIVS